MYIKDVPNFRVKLAQNGACEKNVEFIMNLIQDSKLDEDFKIISQNAYRLMLEKDLWKIFEKTCEDLNIVLTCRFEPER